MGDCRPSGPVSSRARILYLAFLLAISMGGIAAADAPWRVGLGRTEITPEKPIRMKGYAGRTAPSNGILGELCVKALALEGRGEEGDRAVLVTADLCVLRRPLAKQLCERIMKATSLERRQILLNVSHTHAGPLVGTSEWYRYDLSEKQRERIRSYTARFRKQVVATVQEALAEMRPARLAAGQGVADFVMNRREFTGDGVQIGVNPRGYADRSVPVLRIGSPGGEMRAVVFGCATHCTTLTGRNRKISGDYAGIAQRRIEEERRGVQAMFVTGCAGSANPYPRGSITHARRHGKRLAEEVLRMVERDLRSIRGPLRAVFGYAELPLQPVPSRQRLREMVEGPHHKRFNARKMLKALERGESLPSQYEAPVAVWQFGTDLTLVGLSGEVVGEYVPLIETAIGHSRLWPAAYCNDVFGYLPTAGVLEEGGYETKGLVVEAGFFSKDAETALLSKVRELARRAGRSIPD